MKQTGEEYLAYNKLRWGSDSWTIPLREKGKTVGCSFANWKVWPNTLLAHCLILEASKQGKADDLVEMIFKYLYEQGENVGLKETLDKIAKEFGIEGEWNSKENIEIVQADDKKGKEVKGVHMVPHFSFNGVDQPESSTPQIFLDCLRRAFERL